MTAEQVLSGVSVLIAAIALGVTTVLLVRQNKQMEHERNAAAILEAINRLTDPAVIEAFNRLEGVENRYETDESILERFDDSDDDRALLLVAQYFETVACLARRGVLDASLIVDAVGHMLRARWDTIRPFIEHLRRVRSDRTIFESFEWIAMYSLLWKQIPRSTRDPNYNPRQFAGVEFKVPARRE
jgi:Domain of unknown function (DUF4760)